MAVAVENNLAIMKEGEQVSDAMERLERKIDKKRSQSLLLIYIFYCKRLFSCSLQVTKKCQKMVFRRAYMVAWRNLSSRQMYKAIVLVSCFSSENLHQYNLWSVNNKLN